MNAINTALESGLLFAADLVLRTTIVLTVSAGVARLLRGQSASIRRNVWAAGLITVVALPAFMATGPRIPIDISQQEVTVNETLPATTIQLSTRKKTREEGQLSAAAGETAVTSDLSTEPQAAGHSAGTPAAADAERIHWYWIPTAFLCIGTSLQLVLLIVSLWQVRRLLNGANSEIPSEWERDWRESGRQMGMRSRILLYRTTAETAPLTCGFFWPAVLFPQSADSWPEERRRAVMLHELAHVRQRDVAVILLSRIVCALYFFHPLAWFAAKQLRHECERTCDDLVLSTGHRPTEYASHLTAIAKSLAGNQQLTALAMAMSPSSNLRDRVTAILDDTIRRDVPRRKHFAISVAVAVVCGLAIASPQPAPQNTPSDTANVSPAGQNSSALNSQQHRNNVFEAATVPVECDVASRKNILWTAKLGSQTAAAPVVENGKIFVGTNNGGEYLRRLPKNTDLGCLLAFDSESGEFLWQYSAKKLSTGRMNDWPQSGITASPCVDGDRVWIVNNRSEVVCLDTEGFHDGVNDGNVTNEVHGTNEADIVWTLDLIRQFGSFPHNHSDCRITSDGRFLFIVVPNGVDAGHLKLPAGSAPAFAAIDRNTGKVVWTSSVTCKGVMHAQWSSATLAFVNGHTQVLCPGGDGWLYGLDASTGKTIWKFDCNPKEAVWQRGGRGRKNNILGMPLFQDGLVYVTTGQDPEHGEGQGDVWCIDPRGTGDVSPEIADASGIRRNPGARTVWHFDNVEEPDEAKASFSNTFHRSVSTPAVKDGLLIVPDLSGQVHCFDAKTGTRHSVHDLYASCWSSPLIVNNRVYVADEDGDVAVFNLSRDLEPLAELHFHHSIYATPAFADDTLYIATKSHLHAIRNQK